VLNPASVFYLVQIVLAALVLGRFWTWIVTSLSVGGYAALFWAPTTELRAAQAMHPEIALHMRGMWLAFALTAVTIAALVTRLTIAIERRDLALDLLRDRTARATRLASLATLATGAAHELSTPLATIAVAAHELERSLSDRAADRNLHEDARLIRSEIDRCRRVLDDLAGRSGEPSGQVPRAATLSEVLSTTKSRISPDDQRRVSWHAAENAQVVWPVDIVARAVANLVHNALQASGPRDDVRVEAAVAGDVVRVRVLDRGPGMSPDQLARVGEPFFTTKPAGQGTGLGVFVARSSIEQLGGEVALSSIPNAGTTATVTLPRNVVPSEVRQ
jgi:two-component system sensor histidine kinase RegB